MGGIPWLVCASVVLAVWLALEASSRGRWPAELVLRRDEPPLPDEVSVAVLIPARDEAEVLPETLPSVLAQEGGEVSVFVVDDESRDGTAEAARRLARAGRRQLRVIGTGPKPPGWAGKVHAQHRGLAAVLAGDRIPEWLLLTDADIRHPPDSLRRLVGAARRHGRDAVSVMARLHAESFFERLLIPPFVYFFQLLYPFRRVSSDSSEVAAAAGGCLLVKTSTLVGSGGFVGIRNAAIDDVALGRQLKASGARLWLGFDPDIVSVRSYGFKDLWTMVSRSAFVELRYRYRLALGAVVAIPFVFSSPPAVAVWAVARLGTGWTVSAVAALVAALVAWCLQARGLAPFCRHHRVPVGFAWTLPLAAALYAGMTASSAWSHLFRQGATWKGRGYRAEP